MQNSVAGHLSPRVIEAADASRSEFESAQPFRHICIEDFFDPGFAERLLAEFPTFETRLAVNEGGATGGKAVNTKIREISPAYQELYDFISSRPFLDFMSRLSGIPDLLLEAKMYGGGTHENRHGQELDPHIDFNYAQDDGLHRRLNLIVYLNKDWNADWGGAIEIHSNPRLPEENRIRAFDPLFNRAVMFETNEISWHGFPKIDLPEAERHRSRKSISIYLYTKDRPEGEIAPEHGTFYVQRPLPAHLKAGHTLTEADVFELKSLFTRRDRWIELYQKMELDKNRTIAQHGSYIALLKSNLRLPVTGYVLQEGEASGAFQDGWMAPVAKTSIRPLEPVKSISLRSYRPDEAGGGVVTLLVDGAVIKESRVKAGLMEVQAPLNRRRDQAFSLEIRFQPDQAWAAPGDDRELALKLIEIRVEHTK